MYRQSSFNIIQTPFNTFTDRWQDLQWPNPPAKLLFVSHCAHSVLVPYSVFCLLYPCIMALEHTSSQSVLLSRQSKSFHTYAWMVHGLSTGQSAFIISQDSNMLFLVLIRILRQVRCIGTHCMWSLFIYITMIHIIMFLLCKENHYHYRLQVPRGFQEVKVPTIHDNGPGWQ